MLASGNRGSGGGFRGERHSGAGGSRLADYPAGFPGSLHSRPPQSDLQGTGDSGAEGSSSTPEGLICLVELKASLQSDPQGSFGVVALLERCASRCDCACFLRGPRIRISTALSPRSAPSA